MRIPLNSPQCSSFALSKLQYVCTYVLQFQVCGMENCLSTPHLTCQARVDFQWCVELEMESLLSIPYFQCGIPGECCISFHLYRTCRHTYKYMYTSEGKKAVSCSYMYMYNVHVCTIWLVMWLKSFFSWHKGKCHTQETKGDYFMYMVALHQQRVSPWRWGLHPQRQEHCPHSNGEGDTTITPRDRTTIFTPTFRDRDGDTTLTPRDRTTIFTPTFRDGDGTLPSPPEIGPLSPPQPPEMWTRTLP